MFLGKFLHDVIGMYASELFLYMSRVFLNILDKETTSCFIARHVLQMLPFFNSLTVILCDLSSGAESTSESVMITRHLKKLLAPQLAH